MKTRLEPWGAWVRIEHGTEAALVALDREGARAIGLSGGDLWMRESPPASRPLEVHVAVTTRCAAGCEGCYLDARPNGESPAFQEIDRTLEALAQASVFTVAFGGGEPTLREDLGELADTARARGLVPVVTTSGLGVNDDKLAMLGRFAQVNVSYDGAGEVYRAVRGFDATRSAESTISLLAAAGVHVGVNVVLTSATFNDLKTTLRRALALGAREAQLLRYKPAGRAARSLEYLARRLTEAQARRLSSVLREIAAELPQLRVRIDCALVPFLSCDEELTSRPDELGRWGVFGCEAAASLAATKIDGTLAPCSFAAPTRVHARDLGAAAWDTDPLARAFRSYPEAPDEPCASCPIARVCRGGCKVVSSFLQSGSGDTRITPDPECPRVLDHRRRATS